MKILAIETSLTPGSLAAAEGKSVLCEVDLDRNRRTTQTFALAIESVLRHVNWSPRDVDLVAVTSGPGSFTGLRIGITAAKVFAYATAADVVAVNTLDVIADQSRGTEGTLFVAMGAQRKQLFSASYRVAGGKVQAEGTTTIVAQEEWLTARRPGDVVSGPALVDLADKLPSKVTVVEPQFWQPRASTVARRAMARYREGYRDNIWTLVPNYYRKSAAEEKAP